MLVFTFGLSWRAGISQVPLLFLMVILTVHYTPNHSKIQTNHANSFGLLFGCQILAVLNTLELQMGW